MKFFKFLKNGYFLLYTSRLRWRWLWSRKKIKKLAGAIQEEKITLSDESSEILKKAINNPEDLTENDIYKVWNDVDTRYNVDGITTAQSMAAYRVVNLFGDIKAILNK